MLKIALFASGSGSNAENIANYFKDKKDVTIDVIVSNKSEAFVHQRAKKLGIESITFLKHEFIESDKLLSYLKQRGIDYIVLAGFLLKVPQQIIDVYPKKIINIHPALLPKYGGKGMYGDNVHKAVVEAGETESGISIHYVNQHYDEGAIIFQQKCEIASSDTYLDVANKVHELEYAYFPQVLESVFDKHKTHPTT